MIRASLFYKLMGAFALVIVVGSVVVYLIANQATATEFQHFMFRGQMVGLNDLTGQLANYYQARGSWEGAGALLTRGGNGPGGMMGGGGMGGLMNPARLILADARGVVVADSNSGAAGQPLSPGELAGGAPIRVNGQTVGTLVAAGGGAGPLDAPSRDFLSQVNRSLLLAGSVAGLLALALGFVLFRQITAPLDALALASRKIAAGDLQARVPARGGDELAEVGRAFNAMAENLARSEAARRNMLADVAHELRNPLGVIQSHLEAILDGVFTATPEQIASLHDETLLLTRLVEDLRDLALADAGQLSLARRPTDLRALVEHTLAAFQPTAADRNLELTGELASDLPPLNLDAQRVEQVLRNLLGNALRYTPRGGRVRVTLAPGADSARVEVSDTGPGIPAEALPLVFERFWRGDKGRTHINGGAGLGLAIAKQWVTAHGGRIGVTSAAGQGTTFWFTLPRGGNS